jgi:fatty-acyl-CoA synthase
VAESYFGDPKASAAAFGGRWFRTGDVGAWDAAGRLVILDRRSDRMVVGGENVSPAEVEEVLRAHPAVADACVVGVPSGAWGHEVVAAVELRAGLTSTPEELRAHAAAALSPFKVPRRFVLGPALPRTASGKLLRRLVRDRMQSQVPEEERA